MLKPNCLAAAFDSTLVVTDAREVGLEQIVTRNLDRLGRGRCRFYFCLKRGGSWVTGDSGADFDSGVLRIVAISAVSGFGAHRGALDTRLPA